MRKYRHGAHSVFNLKVHLVLVVAYRRKVIDGELLTVLDTLFRHICEEEGVALLEFSGEADHVRECQDFCVQEVDYRRGGNTAPSLYLMKRV